MFDYLVCSSVPFVSTSGPFKVETMTGSSEFAPGRIYFYGEIFLGYSNNDIITLQGARITAEQNKVVCLGMDQNRTMMSMNQTGFQYVIGSAQDNSYILIDNNSKTGILLNSSDPLSGGPLTITAGTNSIILNANGINRPFGNNINFLGVNSSGALVTSDAITFSSLVAVNTPGSYLALGDIIANNNGMYFEYGSPMPMVLAANYNDGQNAASVDIIAAQDIHLFSSQLAVSLTENYPVFIDANNALYSGPADFGNISAANSSTTQQLVNFGFVNGNSIKFYNYGDGIEINSGPQGGDISLFSDQSVVLNANNIMITKGIPKAFDGYTNVLTIDSNGNLGILISSKKFKKDIAILPNMDDAFDKIVVCSYKNNSSQKKRVGFIAEDMAAISDDIDNLFLIYDEHGEILSVDYNGVIALNTQQIIFVKKRMRELEKINLMLQNQVYDQQETINSLKADIEKLFMIYNTVKS